MTSPFETGLAGGGEFDIIRQLAETWGERASGIGDDAAVLPLVPGLQLVVSTDSSVEGVHFRREWLTAYEIGWRAAAAALSDLAAMAAEPLAALTALSLPDSWVAEVRGIADGLGDACAAGGARIVGGDLSRGTELSLTVTVLGSASRPLLRSGAQAGDAVYVTGRLGAPAAALTELQAGRVPVQTYRERFARPQPRLLEGRWLAAHGATAGIDISDGLIADLQHLAVASGVSVELELTEVPTVSGVPADVAAASGEEYELAVCVRRGVDTSVFLEEFGVELTRIGEVRDPAPAGEIILRNNGKRVDPPRGYNHFSD